MKPKIASTGRSRSFISALLLVVWTVFPSRAGAQTPEAVTLDGLIDAAREHHPSLAKQPLLEQSRKLQRSRLSSAYYPHLSLGGQATWQSEVTEVDVPVPGISISPPPQDQYRVTLDLQQTIWDGGVTADQKDAVEKQTQVEHEKANLEWYQVRDRIMKLYFGGVVQGQLEDQAKALEQHLGTLIEKTELLVDQGLATQRDTLLLVARRLEAKQAAVDANKALEGIRNSLEELTGMPLPKAAELAPPPAKCSAEARARPTSGTLHRPDLDVLDAQEDLASAQEKLQRAGDRPRFGAFATAGYGRPGLNFLNDEFRPYFIGGVQLTVPLTYLYAGTHRNGNRQLAVQRSLLAREREAIVTKVSAQHDQTAAELSRLEAALELDAELLRVRIAARKQTELQVELGTSTTSDLVDDLTREDQARSQLAVHEAKRSLACHELAFIKGAP